MNIICMSICICRCVYTVYIVIYIHIHIYIRIRCTRVTKNFIYYLKHQLTKTGKKYVNVLRAINVYRYMYLFI